MKAIQKLTGAAPQISKCMAMQTRANHNVMVSRPRTPTTLIVRKFQIPNYSYVTNFVLKYFLYNNKTSFTHVDFYIHATCINNIHETHEKSSMILKKKL